MRVFISGGTGFVGNHVVHSLLEGGYAVTALVRPGSENKIDETIKEAICI